MKNREKIIKKVVLHAPIEKVWETISTSNGIAGWWMANTFKPELGHDFVLHTGQYGDSPCKVTELEFHKQVGFNWGKDWHLALQVKEVDGTKTEFTLIHSGWDDEKVTEFGQPHSVIRSFMDGGWEKIVMETLPSYIKK